MKPVEATSIEQFSQLLMDSNPQYIFWKDINGVYLGCNKLYAHFCNLASTDAIIGTSDYDYMKAEEAAICLQADKEVMDTGDSILNFEEFVTDAHGVPRWYTINKVPLKDQVGKIVGVLGTMTDVTELKIKNRIIEEQTKSLSEKLEELETKNRELEEFAYAAAHDLQEPLRNITMFSNLLDKKQSLDNDFLEHILINSKRMGLLVNGLLSYSIIGQKSSQQEMVSLNEIVENVLGLMQINIEESKAEVSVKKLPNIPGYKLELVSLFQNLLSNSLKYSDPEKGCKVKISFYEETDSHITICHKDNGIGFDQKYAQKVFEIFKRLKLDKYSGVGIGLSICAKIVRLHSGQIWCESEQDNGTKFYLKFPK